MPEKVHTKFSDDDVKPQLSPLTTTANTNPTKSVLKSRDTQSRSISTGNKGQTGVDQTNGVVKRLRDDSPKSSINTTVPDSKLNKLSSKKQRRNSSASSDQNPRSNGTNSKALYGSTLQKSDSTAKEKGKLHNFNAASQSSRPKPNQQRLVEHARYLENVRKELPIWSKKADIRWALRKNDVLLLSGATGSGKSTQTPQFLYTEPWCKKRTVKIKNKDGKDEEVSVGGMIAITQPRRVAAITLAQRVAAEVGCSLEKGSGHGKVGYSVRFSSNVPPGTRIKFVTEGMLLQEMLRDPHLRKYSAIIVDEIHERSVDVDLISGFLRQILHSDKKGRGGIPLKVVIMSATMDLGGLEAFFGTSEVRPDYEPGKNHGRTLAPHLWEFMTDVDSDSGLIESSAEQSPQSSTDTFSSWEGISSSDEAPSPLSKLNNSNTWVTKGPSALIKENGSKSAKPQEISEQLLTSGKKLKTGSRPKITEEDEDFAILNGGVAKNGVAIEYVKGRQYTVETFYDVAPTPDYLDNMLHTILKLHTGERMPGDILAFLTGQDEIDALQIKLEHYAKLLTKAMPKMKVVPLYGSLPPAAQQEAFEKVKEKNTRKVVLATNIAETSVTVSGVHFVVDCGKSKVKQYRPRLGMDSLLSRPISKVSAIQREGRAGREAKGKCYRLYTAEDFERLEPDEKPEILRSDVIEAVLKMKARGVEDVLEFPLMDRPDITAMEKALLQLHFMGAIDDDGKLTDAGKNMAKFPLPAAYGRVIVAAADSKCILEVIDIVACLTTDSEIFMQPKSEEEELAIAENRKGIQHPKGDILTYLKTMQLYANENADRNEWCRRHNISVRAMKMALTIRRQLRDKCLDQKLLDEAPPPDPQPFEELSSEKAELILKTFLRAFATKTAVLGGDGAYSTTVGRNAITIHPSSVLRGKKVEAIMFLDHVFTAKSFAKKVSAIQANWIAEAFEA